MNKRPLLLLVVALALVVGLAAPASASGGGGDATRVSGRCTATTVWKLKAKARDGGLEAEFEVDSNRNRQVWSVRIVQNGSPVFNGSRTTRPPSGSFSVERNLVDNAGADRIVAIAANARTGERCRGVLTV